MNLVRIDMKMKLVNKLGAVMIIFAVSVWGMPIISPILEFKAEAATMEISPEYARMDAPW